MIRAINFGNVIVTGINPDTRSLREAGGTGYPFGASDEAAAYDALVKAVNNGIDTFRSEAEPGTARFSRESSLVGGGRVIAKNYSVAMRAEKLDGEVGVRIVTDHLTIKDGQTVPVELLQPDGVLMDRLPGLGFIVRKEA